MVYQHDKHTRSPSGKLDCYDLLEYVGKGDMLMKKKTRRRYLLAHRKDLYNIKNLRKEQLR